MTQGTDTGRDDTPGRDDLPRIVRLLVCLLPAAERQAIVGDLLEDAANRHLSGARRGLWLASECGAIAAGLTVTRVRDWLVVPPVRELAAGLALDGSRVLRGGHSGALLRVVIFCGSLATLVLGVELLVATLLSAAGLR
jgi:hypothetical protein